jgi:hypothetical protein
MKTLSRISLFRASNIPHAPAFGSRLQTRKEGFSRYGKPCANMIGFRRLHTCRNDMKHCQPASGREKKG